jgi:hypothetical protein
MHSVGFQLEQNLNVLVEFRAEVIRDDVGGVSSGPLYERQTALVLATTSSFYRILCHELDVQIVEIFIRLL